MSKSTSHSTKLYLKQRLNELIIYEVSDLMVYINSFNQIIGDKVLVNLIKLKDENNVMILLCSLPPLLTGLMYNKEPIIDLSVKSQADGLYVNHNHKSYGNEEERWLEVISWEPKAFVYHNFLVIFMLFIGSNFWFNIFMLVHIIWIYLVRQGKEILT